MLDFADSAYTERYMLQPEENMDGYEATSLLNATAIQKFKNVKFLLAHGEADGKIKFLIFLNIRISFR